MAKREGRFLSVSSKMTPLTLKREDRAGFGSRPSSHELLQLPLQFLQLRVELVHRGPVRGPLRPAPRHGGVQLVRAAGGLVQAEVGAEVRLHLEGVHVREGLLGAGQELPKEHAEGPLRQKKFEKTIRTGALLKAHFGRVKTSI